MEKYICLFTIKLNLHGYKSSTSKFVYFLKCYANVDNKREE